MIDWWAYRDLAGPAATVIAAIGAVTVTSIFASKQAAAAKQQAETARNKLKADLFELKFKSYQSAMSLARLALSKAAFKEIGEQSRKDLEDKVSSAYEARFLFTKELFEFQLILAALAYDCINDREFIEGYTGSKIITDEKLEKHKGDIAALEQMYAQMPEKFERALKISFD